MGLSQFIRPTSLEFIARTHIVGDVYTFTFRPDRPRAWHAGQHGLVEIRTDTGKTARRMFSLSSAPSEDVVSITTHWVGEDRASNFKQALWHMQPGDTARLRGPVGPMFVRDNNDHNVFIAGGIGITPFRSMLLEAAESKQDLHGTLLYANRENAPIIFKDELAHIVKRLPHFGIQFLSSPELVDALVKHAHIDGAMFYLAGPRPMVQAYKKQLRSLGVQPNRIKNDPFIGYKVI